MASDWMRSLVGRAAGRLSLACVIAGRRVSATTHAAPFSLASFHSRHIRRSRPNSIIFGDGRRPRGAIGDYAGGRHGRDGPGRATGSGFVLFGPSTSPGQAPSRSSAAASQALSVGSNVRPRALQTLTSGVAVITSRISLCVCVCLSACLCVCAVSMCAEQRRSELQHSSSTVIVTAPPAQSDPPDCTVGNSPTINRPVVRRPLTTTHKCVSSIHASMSGQFFFSQPNPTHYIHVRLRRRWAR